MRVPLAISLNFAVLSSFLSLLRASPRKCGVSINDLALRGHVTEAIQVDNIHFCNEECKKKIGCMSTNFYRDGMLCELNNRTIAAKPHQKVVHVGAVYFDRLNPDAIGSHQELPAESCMEINNITGSLPSGLFWVKNAASGNVERIRCNGGIPDYCSPSPCTNGGTCVSGASSFSCTCAAGFEGKKCATIKGSWQEFSPYWCTSSYRTGRQDGLTKDQCKAKCTGNCKGMEWWEKSRACFFCSDPSKRQPYTNTVDSGYPPYVLVAP